MYEYIKGLLISITPYHIIVETGGIGYVILSANPYSFSAKVGKEVQVYLHQVVREDSQQLFGFHTLEEKQLFLKLISVSGIGPKSGLAIMASEDVSGLVQAIAGKNIAYLIKFPGVGKKTASQMILDLEGKLGEFDVSHASMPPLIEDENGELNEAMEALAALGYAERDVKRVGKILEKETSMKTEEYLRRAFKLLAK